MTNQKTTSGQAKQSGGQLAASFRDPSGFLFSRGGVLYRQVNHVYEQEYARLMESGLYEKLVKAGLLIPHVEVEQALAADPQEGDAALKVIQPERVPFISYPYEWSFGQLKSAALATLSIQKRALKLGMSLKDASAYNIQFVRGKATLIDTLSFEIYKEGEPWVAYRQFCQHFLAPLALMALNDIRLSQLLRVYIDGVSLDLASGLLPTKTRLNFGLLTHIHLHAGAQKKYSGLASEEAKPRSGSMSKQAMTGLIESLESTIQKLDWTPRGTEWGNYYDITNYSDAAFEHKKQLVSEWTKRVQPMLAWDLGANNGVFSRVVGSACPYVVSFDIDPAAVEQNYRQVKTDKTENLLPLLLDLTNPTPSIGWANRERDSFGARGPADLVLALALIHHLAISNNVPLPQLADFFAETGKWLVIEFVPKPDSQVQKLLVSRKDIFPDYTRQGFEAAFKVKFTIHEAVEVRESERVLYLMESR
ncbi:MAG: SAM-dependent methyltransferase [Chloroflexota bacterium]